VRRPGLRPVVALGLAGLLACATTHQPPTLDGADRVPINDPATVEWLKRRALEAQESEATGPTATRWHAGSAPSAPVR
jgi:hypothetical protein